MSEGEFGLIFNRAG